VNLIFLESAYRRVRRNISASPYLCLAAAGTIAFSLLILGVFFLLYVNVNDLLASWKQEIRMVAYLRDDVADDRIRSLEQTLGKLPGVKEIHFISKDEAMARLRRQMKHRISVLEGLRDNPLPASFEIQLEPARQTWGHVDTLADEIMTFSEIEDVACAEAWLQRFSGFMGFFRLSSLVVGCLVFATTVFVCANTIRLTLYAKRQELEIMRLVGATDGFIKTPFYVQGLMEGLLGAMAALGLLFLAYRLFIFRIQSSEALLWTSNIRFLSPIEWGGLLLVGMLMAWLGSYFSLRHFLKP
jgi:cell division transport system permease protein